MLASMTSTPDKALTRARELLEGATRVVVLAGAGLSTDSGIPDFRGPKGLWTKDPGTEMLSSYEAWVTDPEVRKRGWQVRLTSPLWTAQPNDGHRALVSLEHSGTLDLLVTQNIDGLHQMAGQSPERIVEIHGNNRQSVCLSCGERLDMQLTLARVAAGDEDPTCLRCGGLLKSAPISFGQSLVQHDLERADLAARSCDLLLAVGSTLSVFPVAGLVPTAAHAGASVIIINGEATQMDGLADVVINRDLTTTLLALLGGVSKDSPSSA